MVSEAERPPYPDDESEEISKKDLLRETGLSYGQFYRWKRMGLIPESWFHRRSTFTGQETFLPRRKLLDRIRQIQELRERYPLEEIARMLSPDSVRPSYSRAALQQRGLFSPRAWDFMPTGTETEELHFLELLGLMLAEHLIAEGKTANPIIEQAVRTLIARYDDLGQTDAEKFLIILSRNDITLVVLHTGVCLFDEDTQIVTTVNLNGLVGELNLRLRDLIDQ